MKIHKSKFTKFCHICGRHVDLRKRGSFEISHHMSNYIVNKDYRYICSKECGNKFKEK